MGKKRPLDGIVERQDPWRWLVSWIVVCTLYSKRYKAGLCLEGDSFVITVASAYVHRTNVTGVEGSASRLVVIVRFVSASRVVEPVLRYLAA